MFNGLWRKVIGKKPESREIAKKRLKITLIYDKLEVSEDILSSLHRDMIEVISRYFEIDREAFKIDIRRNDDQLSALVVNTPILKAKHQRN